MRSDRRGTAPAPARVPTAPVPRRSAWSSTRSSGPGNRGRRRGAWASDPPARRGARWARLQCPAFCHASGMSPVRLRPATLADLELLEHWDEQPHVVASDPKDDWGWERELAFEPDWREQLVAELDGRPIGFLQIIAAEPEETRYWGDVGPGYRAIDIWIGEASDLSRGYGTAMMRLALARCFAEPGVRAVLIDPLASNTRAQRFYERLGFRFVEHRRFGDDDCCVYRLYRAEYAGA